MGNPRPSQPVRTDSPFPRSRILKGIESRGTFAHSMDDCQRMIHEMQVYQVELDAMSEELSNQDIDLQAWRDDTKQVQREITEAAEAMRHLSEGIEREQIQIRSIEATLQLFQERFRLLIQDVVQKAL